MTIAISVVLPIYNEESVLPELLTRLTSALELIGRSYEIVCVNDGSTDSSLEILNRLAFDDSHIRVIALSQNMGQTAAIDSGIGVTFGDYVILMDADLQHDPNEIGIFIRGLDEGYDIVSGWRQRRVDHLIARRIPSFIANRMMKAVTGIALNDFGTTYKGYRGDLIRSVSLYSRGFHRFIPVLLRPYRPKILEVPITNISRTSGVSSYGIGRTFTVFWDIIKLGFIVNFATNPLHFIGPIASVLLSVGGVTFIILLIKKMVYGTALLATHGIILLLSVLLILIGLQVLSTGLVMELIVYSARHRRRRRVVNGASEVHLPVREKYVAEESWP